MKIIKEGKVPTATANCPICGCEFEYEPRDVSNASFNNDYATLTYGCFVRCPQCGKEIHATLPSL